MNRILSPDSPPAEKFTDATKAVEHLIMLYRQATGFLTEHFQKSMDDAPPATRIRAFYPESLNNLCTTGHFHPTFVPFQE